MNFEEFKQLLIENKIILLCHRKTGNIYQTNSIYHEGSDNWNNFWNNHLIAKEFLNKNFKSWDRFILCLKLGIETPPKCPICNNFLKVNLSHARWYSTCGQPECINAYLNLEETKEKRYQKNEELYGNRFPIKLKEFQEKKDNTCREKYGVKNPMSTKEVKEKKAQTSLERYGNACSLLNEKVKEKAEQTLEEKYGEKVYFNSEDFFYKRLRPYKYKDLKFDSSWELAFYIYNEDNGIILEREPGFFIYYDENLQIERKYWPDFYNKDLNKYYEIKSSYTTENTSKGKLNLIKEMKIEFLGNEEIKFYLNYIKDKYGNNYLLKFKVY